MSRAWWARVTMLEVPRVAIALLKTRAPWSAPRREPPAGAPRASLYSSWPSCMRLTDLPLSSKCTGLSIPWAPSRPGARQGSRRQTRLSPPLGRPPPHALEGPAHARVPEPPTGSASEPPRSRARSSCRRGRARTRAPYTPRSSGMRWCPSRTVTISTCSSVTRYTTR